MQLGNIIGDAKKNIWFLWLLIDTSTYDKGSGNKQQGKFIFQHDKIIVWSLNL